MKKISILGVILALLFSGVLEAAPKRRAGGEEDNAASDAHRRRVSGQDPDKTAATASPPSRQLRTRAQHKAATAVASSPKETTASIPTAASSSTKPLRLIDILIRRLEEHFARRRVLSIDGGGVRGAFAARIAAHIEQQAEQSISELFQGSITGTSTGSLIALGLLSPDKEDQPGAGPYTAAEIVDFYRERASHMFSGCCAAGNCIRSSQRGFFWWTKNLLCCFRCCGCFHNCKSVCGPRYTREALDAELQALLGSTRPLEEALGPVQTTTYDVSRGGGIVYLSSTDPQTKKYLFPEAAAASSAAPTFFPLASIGDGSPTRPRRLCVDGGLFENNPTLSALRQARTVVGDGHDLGDFTVVSIGTGQSAGALTDENLQQAGALAWARTAVSVAMAGTSEAIHSSFAALFSDGNYFRLQARLPTELLAMDNPDNVEGLIKEADRFCSRTDPTTPFNRFLARLEREKKFMNDLRTLYGELENKEFLMILKNFKKFIGVTHEETSENISRLVRTDEFSSQILYYFNDVRLLRALAIEAAPLLRDIL